MWLLCGSAESIAAFGLVKTRFGLKQWFAQSDITSEGLSVPHARSAPKMSEAIDKVQLMYGRRKQDPNLRLAALAVMNHVPTWLAYSSSYTQVLELSEKAEKGEDISALLGARLARVLRIALTRVPHYRELGLGIAPEEIDAQNSFEVLLRFPYLEKSDIRRAPEALVAAPHDPERLYQVRTGGSTGQPVTLYRSRFDQSAEAGFIHHGWGKAGYTRSGRLARIGSEGLRPLDREPVARWGNRLLISPNHLNEQWVPHIYEELQRFAPRFIHSYPSALEYLSDYMNASGLGLPSIGAIFLASEQVTRRQLHVAEQVFGGVPVVFHYGLSERTNLAWGRWAQDEIVYQFNEAYGYSENRQHPGGGQEIVGTSYWNEVMPLIRYRTQDYGEIAEGALASLEGRAQEYLTTATGMKIPGICIALGDLLLEHVEGVQIVQERAGHLEFRITPGSGYDDAIGERFLESQREQWDDAFSVTLSLAEHVERSPSGKIRRYVIKSEAADSLARSL